MYVNDRVLDLRQVGPNHAVVREPEDLPPGPAEIAVIVDGREHVSLVILIEGMSRLSERVKIVSANPGNNEVLRPEHFGGAELG